MIARLRAFAPASRPVSSARDLPSPVLSRSNAVDVSSPLRRRSWRPIVERRRASSSLAQEGRRHGHRVPVPGIASQVGAESRDALPGVDRRLEPRHLHRRVALEVAAFGPPAKKFAFADRSARRSSRPVEAAAGRVLHGREARCPRPPGIDAETRLAFITPGPRPAPPFSDRGSALALTGALSPMKT